MTTRATSWLLVALMLVPLALAAQPVSDPVVSLAGHVPAFVATAQDLGPAPPDRPVVLVVALSLRDEDALLSFTEGRVEGWRAPAELLARHSPSEATVEDVRAWLATRGLPVSRVSADRTLLVVETRAADASTAFGAPLRLYGDPEAPVMAPSAAPHLPARLAPRVQAIVGLTEAPLSVRSVGLATDGLPPFLPADLRRAYEVDPVLAAGHDGSGRAVAITGWGAADQVSLDDYSVAHGLPLVTLTHVDAQGGAACGGAELEWDLDVQLAHAMAPAAALHVYCGDAPTFAGMLAAIERVVSDDVADVVSQSWGTCEQMVDPATASAYATKFLQAAAQGIAFFTASGDAGSRECTRAMPGDPTISPSWPATAPHTTSVAGTRLTMSGSQYAEETTWNTCTPCPGGMYQASGGGPSFHYGKPSWQTAPAGATRRASADVSAVADPATGVRVRHEGAWVSVGGTSVSAPLVAGMWADAVTAHGRMGHAAPRLWSVAGDALALRDITTGTNGDFQAGVGYDHPTGLGTPRLAGLVDALARPGAPRALTAAGGPGEGEISLAWLDAFGNADSYIIYMGNSSGQLSPLATTSATTFRTHGIPAGSTRFFQVAAQNGAGEGPRSAEASARAYEAPLPPRALVATTLAGVSLAGPVVRVTWQPPANANLAGVYAYELHRDGMWFETLPGASATSFNDDLCPLAVTCTYAVKALGVVGASALSNSDSELGLSAGIASGGTPSVDQADAPRLIGHERVALQMDADDHNAPLNGMTRDSGLLQDHAQFVDASLAPGRFGSALRLPGSEDALVVLVDGMTSQMGRGTLMMWVDLSQAGTLFDKTLHGADPTLRLQVDGDGRVGFATTGPLLQTAPGAVSLTGWHHITATWGPGGKRIYVDGALLANDLDTSPVTARSGAARIGPGVIGTFDEVRLYDVALPGGLAWNVATRPYAR